AVARKGARLAFSRSVQDSDVWRLRVGGSPEPVQSKYSSSSAVVSKQPAEAFTAADATAKCSLAGARKEQHIPFPLVIAL
ncbi:MAG TPA: hypothetical protein VHN74_20630, partial [Candidatus Angelobacter sp.]|nr:hypothetical protein [Candidatus Angelobacter sp.]